MLVQVMFIPFAYTIDQYRWALFDGSISPSELNAKWWELRRSQAFDYNEELKNHIYFQLDKTTKASPLQVSAMRPNLTLEQSTMLQQVSHTSDTSWPTSWSTLCTARCALTLSRFVT